MQRSTIMEVMAAQLLRLLCSDDEAVETARDGGNGNKIQKLNLYAFD